MISNIYADKVRTQIQLIGILCTAALGALLALIFVAPVDYNIGGLVFNISAIPSKYGITTIDISPFGTISATTHNTPLTLLIQLKYIGTETASHFLEGNGNSINAKELINELVNTLVKSFISRQLIAVFCGAFILTLIFWRKNVLEIFVSSLICLLLFTLLLVSTATEYNVNAFSEPEYCGVISLAPQIIAEPDQIINKFEEVQDNTRRVVAGMRSLMDNTESISWLSDPVQDQSLVKVLLASDLHSSPLGVELIKEMTNKFDIDIILDSGDLTDFGSSLETEFTTGLNDLNVPYVFCPGNHDTPEIIEFIRSMPKGVVLEGSTVSIAGVSILGTPDPLAFTPEVEIEDKNRRNLMLAEQAQDVIDAAATGTEKPDLVVVHDPGAANQLTGLFPLIIHGHTHQQSISISDDSIVLNPGTTGAAGLRGLYADKAIPYSAMILYIKPGYSAVAVDTIKYEPFSDRFYVERKLLHPDLRNQERVINEQPLAEEYTEVLHSDTTSSQEIM